MIVVSVVIVGCGKRGPPLPPLVRVPVAPGDFTATRRGDTVEIQFTVPSANTDSSRPANVERVEVYALEGGPPVNEDDFERRRVKVATVAVKSPHDPDKTIDPGEPADDIEPLEGRGLDQGVVALAEESLAGPLARPEERRSSSKRRKADVDGTARPLLGVWMTPVPSRSYISLGVNKSGKKGPVSKPAIVPLLQPPSAPPAPSVTFDESAVTLAWSTSPSSLSEPGSGGERVLASRPIGQPVPALSYHVFEIMPAAAPGAARKEVRLTKTPIVELRFSDPRMTWGATRCYAVRTVLSVTSLAVESEAPPPACVTLKDTFPPAAPKALTAVGSEGAVSLIWEPAPEKDLDGYLVLRGSAEADLKPITPAPIRETNFRDALQPGARYAYAVRAVDKAGNLSPLSNRVEETAR